MITHRLARAADIASIVRLLSADFLGAQREVGDVDAYLPAFQELQAAQNIYLVVMCSADEVIGTFHLTIIPSLSLAGARRANIESVHIDAELRGSGHGTRMMEYAIGLAREKGARMVQLATNKQRHQARRFYEKLGFVASHDGMKLALPQP